MMGRSMAAITVNKDEFIKRCEQTYARNKKDLERQHYGKLVALYEDGVASVADSIDEAFSQARRKLPGKIFYVRRIGKYSVAGILF